MGKFKLQGVAFFSAENIDDAFEKLAEHFNALSEGRETTLFEPNTDLHITREIVPRDNEMRGSYASENTDCERFINDICGLGFQHCALTKYHPNCKNRTTQQPDNKEQYSLW
ncbi:hypothetical protein LCGC14_1218550 [marine sediment metagenome]|uniref:Uncharacterized protein n=1 Tax=marine sediment metagenome TaxID=412755 RepID=A0A0F9LC09_9ZZZZ